MEQKVKNLILEKLGISERDYNLTSDFREDWGCDSLEVVELIMECEKEFNLSIPDEAVEHIRNAQDLLNYIKEHAK